MRPFKTSEKLKFPAMPNSFNSKFENRHSNILLNALAINNTENWIELKEKSKWWTHRASSMEEMRLAL